MTERNMDELTFRKELLSNPNMDDSIVEAYLRKHPEACEFIAEVKGLDKAICQTLQIPVPEGLQEKIILQQSFEQQAEDSWWQSPKWAMAASFSLVMIIAAVWFSEDKPFETPLQMQDAVIEHVIEHVVEAPELLESTDTKRMDDLQQLFASVGASLNRPIDYMAYADECSVGGKTALHLILDEKQGPVTIIVIPGEKIDAMQAFTHSGYQGELIPVTGGVVAIVGESYEQLAMAQAHFFEAVKFG